MSHFTDVGFQIEEKEDIARLFEHVKSISRKQEFGKYVQYVTEDSSGACLYWHFTRGGLFSQEKFMGVTPTFVGKLSQHIREPRFKPNAEWPLEPSLELWVSNPQTNEEYPLIVDMVNYLEVQSMDFTKLESIKIVLLANSFEYFLNEDDFWKKYPKKDKVHFPAPGMFIPTGTFSPNDNPNFEPHAECWCYGKVIKAEKLFNRITNHEFYHFTMEAYAATYDVITHSTQPIDLNDVAIVGGTFWPNAIL